MSDDRTIRINIDATGAQAGAGQTNAALNSIATNATRAGGGVASLQNGMNTLGGTSAKTASQIAAAAKASDDLVARSDRLLASVDKNYANQMKWNAALKEAQTLHKAGAIDDAELATVSTAVSKGLNDMGSAGHGSAGALRELFVLIREGSRGDMTRMAGSASILATRMGLIEAAGIGAVVGVGALVAVAGVLAYALAAGSSEANRFENSIRLSGNYAGLTASSYLAMAEAIGSSTGTSISSNEGLISSLAKTNTFTKQEIQELVTSADLLSKATGESADDIIADFEKMAEGPAKYAQSYLEKYSGVINPTQVAHIKLLEDTGNKTAALKELVQDVNDGIARNTVANAGYMVRAWNSVTTAISNAWTRLKEWGATETTQQQLIDVNAQIAASPRTRSPTLLKEQADLTAKLAAEQKAADLQSAQTQKVHEAADAARDLDTSFGSIGDHAAKFANDVARAKKDIATVLKAGPSAPGYADALYKSQHMGDLTADIRKKDMPDATRADNKAESAAERLAKQEAERQKRANDFLNTLDAQSKAAAEMPIQAEITTKEQQLATILGKTALDQVTDKLAIERITNDVIAQRQSKALSDLKTQNDASQAEVTYRQSVLGLTDRQAAIEEAGKEKTVELQKQVGDYTTSALNAEVERAKAIAGQNYDLQQQAKLLADIGSLSEKAQQLNALKSISDQQSSLDTLKSNGTLAAKYGADADTVYKQASQSLTDAATTAANTFKQDFANSISDLASDFTGKLGAAIKGVANLLNSELQVEDKGNFTGLGPLGGLINILGKNKDGSLNPFGSGAKDGVETAASSTSLKGALKSPLDSLSSGFSGFKDDLKGIFGKSGSLSKSLGDVAGKAAAGFQMGQTTDSVLKALGAKSSKLGAELGGAVGSAIAGPIGGLIGSIGGGLLGGLFKSTPKGATSLSIDSYGDATTGTTTGNNAAAKAASVQGASGVTQGLDQIAQTLGASLTGDISNIVIGQRGGKWRVQTNGGDSLKTSKGATDFGKDGEQDAIEAAIKDALQQGVLTGLSDFSEKVLKDATDIDAATKLAASWESVLKDLRAYDDPVAGAVEDLVKQFTDLQKQMIANGATTQDLAQLDQWHTDKKKDALDEQLSDLQSFMDALTGDSSGKTSLGLLTDNLTKLAGYQSDLKAGKTVDQSTYTSLGSSILSEAKDVYGTASTDYQDIVSQLTAATTQAIGNVTTDFNNAVSNTAPPDTTMAVQAQTAALQSSLSTSNAYLAQIAASLAANNNTVVSVAGGGAKTVNGKLINAV